MEQLESAIKQVCYKGFIYVRKVIKFWHFSQAKTFLNHAVTRVSLNCVTRVSQSQLKTGGYKDF